MKKGFTLIELLIVVAIIAILAAIAVPNFLEAQTRAKVARERADMRTIATALETYKLDTNKYPPDGGNKAATINWPPGSTTKLSDFGQFRLNNIITTPIAYLTTSIYDTFVGSDQPITLRTLRYFEFRGDYMDFHPSAPLPGPYAAYQKFAGEYQLISVGPNKQADTNTGYPGWQFNMVMPYDATNGTVSKGDIIRTQKNPEGYQL